MIRNVIIFCLLLAFCSCKEEWDTHYKDGSGPMERVDKTVYEYLTENAPEYAEFVSLMETTKADTVLQEGLRYTVWVTDSIPVYAENYSDSLKGLEMRNHILSTEILATAFSNDLEMRTVDHKILWLEGSSNAYNVNGNAIIKTVAVCKDGIIYEIDGFLDRAPNLLESFWNDSDYSLLREIVETFTDSTVDHVDEYLDVITGDVVLDTIWKVSNTISLVLGQEKNILTIFLTDNTQLRDKMGAYFADVKNVTGKDPVKADTTKLNDFIAKSFIHNSAIDEAEYYAVEKRTSVFKKDWRTSYQKVTDGSREKCSNGYLYRMDQFFVPTNLINVDVESFFPAKIYDLDTTKVDIDIDSIPDLIVISNTTSISGSEDYLEIKSELPPTEDAIDYNFSVSWNTGYAKLNQETELPEYKESAFMGGEYLVNFTYVVTDNASQDFEVYINDQFQSKVNYSPSDARGVPIVVNLGRVKIPSGGSAEPIKVTMKNVGNSWKRGLAPYSIRFERTVNNY